MRPDLAANLSRRVPKVTLLTLPRVGADRKGWFPSAEHPGGKEDLRHDQRAAGSLNPRLRDLSRVVDLHDDGLRFGEELAAEVPAFASDAAVADAAERGAQVPNAPPGYRRFCHPS